MVSVIWSGSVGHYVHAGEMGRVREGTRSCIKSLDG